MTDYDVIIVGGGMVGLSAAVALVNAKCRVAIVESREPMMSWDESMLDARVSAINPSNSKWLSSLGIWRQLRTNYVNPLQNMEVWDAQGSGEIHFDRDQIGQTPLGHIAVNRELVRVMWHCLMQQNNVDIFSARTPEQLTVNDECATVQLDNHQEISAQLIIGADGAKSWLRQAAGIDSIERSYDHDAVVAIVEAEFPHFNTAYQPFLQAGPLGVLPLADANRMAIVWSAQCDRANELMQLEAEQFNQQLTSALQTRLGLMTLVGERVKIPLIMRHAKQYVLPRVALMGDAAHTIHPLAGQGVNLGFKDAQLLTQIVEQAQLKKQDLGALRLLRRYERERRADNSAMLWTMRGFKDLFSSSSSVLMRLRNQGLHWANQSELKNLFLLN